MGDTRVRDGVVGMVSMNGFPGDGGGSVNEVGADEYGLSVDWEKLEILCRDFFAESGGGT